MRLLLRRADARERIRHDFRQRAIVEFLREPFQHEFYLIESTLALAALVKRHGHQENFARGKRTRRCYLFAQEIRKHICTKLCCVPGAVVLERADKIFDYSVPVIHKRRDMFTLHLTLMCGHGDVFWRVRLRSHTSRTAGKYGIRYRIEAFGKNVNYSHLFIVPCGRATLCRWN